MAKKGRSGGKNTAKTKAGKAKSAPASAAPSKPIAAAAPVVDKTLRIEAGEWADLLAILHETHQIWSAGLSKTSYYHYLWWQMTQPWGRANFRYLIGKLGGEAVTSCKLYTLRMHVRGRELKLAGIGAVYTPLKHRGHDYARTFLKKLIEQCEADGYDGMMLYCDIETKFYESLGFEKLTGHEFYIFPHEPQAHKEILALPGFAEEQDLDIDAYDATVLDVPLMLRHYRRWLRRQPFGFARDAEYWSFKLARETYVRTRSERVLPAQELIWLDAGSNGGGYALIERVRKILRVLEVVGSEQAVEALWRHILRTSLLTGVSLIRGWEGVAPSFFHHKRYIERDWGTPMILPFSGEVERMISVVPCPILEMDHF